MLSLLSLRGRRSLPEVFLLCLGLGAATACRAVLGAPQPAASMPAAVLFAAALLSLAAVAGVGGARPALVAIAAGLAVGGGMFLLWALAVGAMPWLRPAPASGSLGVWSAVVLSVAVAEELFFRGALFAAAARRGGDWAALAATSVAFALVHVPLYGWQAVPVDVAVGAALGGLRLSTGGVAAPAAAHAALDLLAGWLS